MAYIQTRLADCANIYCFFKLFYAKFFIKKRSKNEDPEASLTQGPFEKANWHRRRLSTLLLKQPTKSNRQYISTACCSHNAFLALT
jgi:hypothetical protein